MLRPAVAAVLAAWLALGVGGKLVRYAPEREAAGPRIERLTREFLVARGWTVADRTAITGAGLYAAQSFTKPGCPRPLRVVVLGPSAEASEVVRASLGADTALVGDRRSTAETSPIAYAAGIARAGLSLSADQTTFRLAMSPAPKAGDPCSPPAADTWATIGTE